MPISDNCTNEQKIALYLETDKPELKKILLNELFKKHEKLIHKLVNKFAESFKYLDRNDIFNEAFIVYKHLLDGYNSKKKCKFTSYIHNYLPKSLARKIKEEINYNDFFNKYVDFDDIDDKIKDKGINIEQDSILDFNKDIFPKISDVLNEQDMLLLKYRYGLNDNEILPVKKMAEYGIISDNENTLRVKYFRLMQKIRKNKDKIFEKEE